MAEFVKIDGLKELAAAMRELPLAIQRQRMRGPVALAASQMRDDARRRAPVAAADLGPGRPRPGTLRRAVIIKRIPASPDRAIYIMGVRHGKAFQKYGKREQNVDAYYWRFLEFGTSHAAARPFMRPAFEAGKQQALDTIIKGLREGVEAEAQRLGSRR